MTGEPRVCATSALPALTYLSSIFPAWIPIILIPQVSLVVFPVWILVFPLTQVIASIPPGPSYCGALASGARVRRCSPHSGRRVPKRGLIIGGRRVRDITSTVKRLRIIKQRRSVGLSGTMQPPAVPSALLSACTIRIRAFGLSEKLVCRRIVEREVHI